jgi:hypothetical protein
MTRQLAMSPVETYGARLTFGRPLKEHATEPVRAYAAEAQDGGSDCLTRISTRIQMRICHVSGQDEQQHRDRHQWITEIAADRRVMSARQRDDEGAAGVYDRYPAETPSSIWLVKSLLKT